MDDLFLSRKRRHDRPEPPAAIGAMHGLVVGLDPAAASYNSIQEAEHAQPALASPFSDIGRRPVAMLLALVAAAPELGLPSGSSRC